MSWRSSSRVGGIMKIKEIIWQSRRDFSAIFECEHCGAEEKHNGYDDANFHSNVIPDLACKKCGKKAKDTYRPMATKYPEGMCI